MTIRKVKRRKETNLIQKKTYDFLKEAIKESKFGEYGLNNLKTMNELENKSEWVYPSSIFYTTSTLTDIKNLWNFKKDCNTEELRSSIQNNIVWDKDYETNDIYSQLGITDLTARALGPFIDVDCSGYDLNNNLVWRVFNSLYEFREHCRRNKCNHMLRNGCLFNFSFPSDHLLIRTTESMYYLIKKNKNQVGEKKDNKNEFISIYGNNITTACSILNKTMLDEFLNKYEPDFLMLNENGPVRVRNVIKNKNYQILSKSEKTALIFNKLYGVHLIMENLNDENNLIAKVTCDGNVTFILYCVYLTPGDNHELLLNDFLNKCLAVRRRYDKIKMIIFGDFNLTRDEYKKKVESILKGENLIHHYYNSNNAITRIRMTQTRLERNYLDYMITEGFTNTEFNILRPFAKTDHFMLRMRIDKSECSQLKIKKEFTYCFNKALKESQYIKDELVKSLDDEDSVKTVTKLINSLRKRYKPTVKKAKSIFPWKSKIKHCMKENKVTDWETLAKAIKNVNTREYHSFLKNIGDMGIKNKDKEFFLGLRFYSQLSKTSGIIDNLEIEEDGDYRIETDRGIVDDKIMKKYKKLLDDNGKKKIYRIINGSCINIDKSDVISAIERLNLKKATSWDYIPGEVFNLILNDRIENPTLFNKTCDNIARLLNNLFSRKENIPEQLFCSRLICLNKDPESHGKIDNTRPIAINGVLFKIYERFLMDKIEEHVNNNNIINKKQTGFIKGLGCDINLIRLRTRAADAIEVKNNEEKYILFVDLKQAYDSVNHKLLIEKMKKLNFPLEVINTVKKIYSSTRMRMNTIHDPILVNRGLLQGGITSPYLFNIYINDLVDELDKNAFEVLAYADDLAIICTGYDELINVMNILDKWSMENEIKINKKKSGILIFKNNRKNYKFINDYPVKSFYRYLGVRIDDNLNPRPHLLQVEKKLNGYLSRNRWLIKQYFTPKTMVYLAQCFQISRLSYGMSIFLDKGKIIDTVERLSMKYVKSIVGVDRNVSNVRMRLALGIPKLEHLLFLRLNKIVRKYEGHFNECPYEYRNILNIYYNWIGEIENEKDYQLKRRVIEKSLKDMGNMKGIDIGDEFLKMNKKYWFRYPDKRDGLVIRYLLNYGFFKERLFPVCRFCGEKNSRTHMTNHCPAFDRLRKEKLEEIKRVLGELEENDNLEKEILRIYYCPDKTWSAKTMLKLMKIVKESCASFYIDRPREMESLPAVAELKVMKSGEGL